jgi:hypothetical protein
MTIRIKYLSYFLSLALLEPFAAWLLLYFYITGIDLVWSINIIFIFMCFILLIYSLHFFKLNRINLFFLLIFIISFVKLLIYIFSNVEFEFKHIISYAYGIIMPFLTLNFTSTFITSDREKVFFLLEKFSEYYIIVAFTALVTYSILYFAEVISYFGLGINLHYVYPFFLASQKIWMPGLFLFIILISGKRSVLINFIIQTLVYLFSNLYKKPFFSIIMISGLFLSLLLIYQNTELLERFNWFFNGNLDFEDSYAVYASFSGRYEEILGILKYFRDHPLQIFFGSPPGAYYLYDTESYVVSKNYSHITFAGFVFRYGVICAITIYLIFLWIILKRWSPKSPLYLVFIGILSSSFFGANLIIDPISWLFIGLLLNSKISTLNNKAQ